jgi:hypothetical protein
MNRITIFAGVFGVALLALGACSTQVETVPSVSGGRTGMVVANTGLVLPAPANIAKDVVVASYEDRKLDTQNWIFVSDFAHTVDSYLIYK